MKYLIAGIAAPIVLIAGILICNHDAFAAKTKRPNPTPNPVAPKGDKPGDPPSPTKPMPPVENRLKVKVYDGDGKLVGNIYFP